MPRSIPLLIAILLLPFVLPGASRPARANGGENEDEALILDADGFKPYNLAVYGEDFVIVVATILSVRDSGATHDHPPVVTIDVLEVLRGSVHKGPQTISWAPVPLYMPCPVGEENNIKRWRTTPMQGPAVGVRMILGGDPAGAAGEWECSVFCRWPYSDSLRADVKARVREWMPRAEQRRRGIAAAEREDERRRLRRATEREVRLRAEKRRWMGRERLTAQSAPIELLVRSSSDIVLGTMEWPPGSRGPWRRQLHALEWLRASGRDSSAAVGRVALFMGLREDSLARRWNECPPDLEAGGRPGDTLRVIAFLRYAHDPLPHVMPRAEYRPTDPRYGFLLGDPATERRVRAAVSRWRNQPLEPSGGCGASLSEFTRLDPTEAAGVGIKLTPVSAQRRPMVTKRRTLILGCSPSHHPVLSSLSPGWFCPCLLPAHRYAADFTAAWGALLKPEQMSVLLDSLATCMTQHPAIGEGDSMTVTLRRVRNGEERVYEAAVDGEAFMTIVRTLAALFPSRENRPPEIPVYRQPSTPESIIRTNLVSWTSAVDPRCAPLWND